jgi:succinate dehydrogenase/fumarate reductase cytochrome b subunit (b558 family)
MIQHLIANSYSLRGEKEFNTVVSAFGYLPFVALMEWGIVFIPILFHSIYGFLITAEMRANTGTYQYGRNWLYLAQRVSGVVAFAYIAYHTYSTWGVKKLFEMNASHEAGFRAISYDAMTWRFADSWYVAVYLIGILASTFHLGNGLFNFGIRWGLTVGNAAQRISASLFGLVGAGLFVVGAWTSINFYAKAQNFKGTGQSIRSVYPTLDALVQAEDAPAAPELGAKP